MKAFLILANGFEEMEVTYSVAILRELGVDLKTVSISSEKKVCSSHEIILYADLCWDECDVYSGDILILPGGQPGTNNLASFAPLKDVIVHYFNHGIIAAICAAPSILGDLGLLNNCVATCFPDYEERLKGANIVHERVVTDGNIITSRGAGTAADFAFAIAEKVIDPKTINEAKKKFLGI